MRDGKTEKSEVSSSKNEWVIGILFINISHTFRDLAIILSTIWILPKVDQDIFGPVSGGEFKILLVLVTPYMVLCITQWTIRGCSNISRSIRGREGIHRGSKYDHSYLMAWSFWWAKIWSYVFWKINARLDFISSWFFIHFWMS